MPATPPERAYKHAPIAADLRERIAAGEFPPGSPLPSTPDIQRSYRVGNHTARAALHQLIDEGIAQVRPKRGTFVTARPGTHGTPPPRRTHTARRLAPSEAPTTGDHNLTTRRRTHPTEETPPGDVALKLDTDRATVTREDLTDPTGHVVARRTTYDTGHEATPDTVMTHTYARTATDEEARALGTTGAPVVLCQDETHTDTAPIRLVRTVYRADQVRLSDQYRPRT